MIIDNIAFKRGYLQSLNYLYISWAYTGSYKEAIKMNESLLIVIIIIAIVILAPVVGIIIRKRDFRRQVTGKKPIREMKADEHVPDTSSKDAYTEADRLKDEARMYRFRDSNGGSVMH